MKKNKLYRAILEEFIIKILSDGNNMEFFLEGSRSRTGKILDVDFDILDIIVNSVLDEHVNDVCIVPVALNYEKVLEGDTFPE
jgi:glycerol-3-phosphate O-acyltransferase